MPRRCRLDHFSRENMIGCMEVPVLLPDNGRTDIDIMFVFGIEIHVLHIKLVKFCPFNKYGHSFVGEIFPIQGLIIEQSNFGAYSYHFKEYEIRLYRAQSMGPSWSSDYALCLWLTHWNKFHIWGLCPVSLRKIDGSTQVKTRGLLLLLKMESHQMTVTGDTTLISSEHVYPWQHNMDVGYTSG